MCDRTDKIKQPRGLIHARAEKALAKRRVNSMSAVDRNDIVHQREIELQRFLLPDAPSRIKRVKKVPSPDRDVLLLLPEPQFSAVDPVPSVEDDEQEPPMPEPMTEPQLEPEPELVPQPKLDLNTDVTDKNIKSKMIDSLQFDDSDVDLDIDDSDHDLDTSPYAADMNEVQTKVLQIEDELNDRALRDLLPNEDSYHFDWTKDSAIYTSRRDTFTGSSGPTFDMAGKTPVDIFYKMFDEDFIRRLCTETNRYANRKIASLKAENKLHPNSRLRTWTPTDRDEMITFLASLILQGLYPLPEEEKCFSFNGFGTMPYFSRVLSYNRFILLKMLYHFVDNKKLTDRNKLCKIRPVLDYFNEKFSKLYMPSQEIVIDECLLKQHGRLSFVQKIATKVAQVGIKTYELCESSSGYVWKFFVYVGKNTSKDQTALTNDIPTDDDTVDQPANETVDRAANETVDRPDLARPTKSMAKIVLDLVQPLLERGHTLVLDNFYNSPLLLRYLKKHRTDCYGSFRLNREFVPDSLKTLTKHDLRQGESVASYCSDLCVIVWRCGNLVSMISTYHQLQVGIQNKQNRLTHKPKIVLDYNKSMCGVDRKDQFLSAQLRNKVWYKKVFCRLLSTAMFNAFVICSSKNSRMTHRQFQLILAESLLKIHRRVDLTTEPRLYTRQLVTRKNKPPHTVDHNHFPMRAQTKNGCCKVCSRQKIKTRTIWKCIECDVSLCIENCFREYHKLHCH